MSDILKQIQALQEQFSNLLGEELEKEGPKKPEVTSSDFDPFKYGMLMNKLSKDKHKYLKAMGQAQYDKGSKEEKELVQRKKSKREKKEMKMNDNNSYNEIVSQIMDLKEAFSNLFEVEGLGNPAVDVPPSQNKIKKDRKTKDGKVELVSVEDELFPYDGNKREQYRQKILDTINNMIQGTATLEDLLQIVRQKKAPLKEAMELMEDLLDKRTKNEKGMEATRKRSDHGAPYRDYINHKELYPHNQGITGNEEKDLKREAKGLYKAIDHYNTWNKEHGYNPHPGSYITGLKCDLAKVKNTLKQINNYKKYDKHEALEEALSLMEAMEILENIYSQIEKVHGEPEWRNTRAGFIPMNKSAELTDKADKNGAEEEKQAAERQIKGTSMTYPEGEDFIDKKRNETKNKSLDELPSDVLGHVGFDFKELQDRKAAEATKKSIARHEKKEQKKAPLKEAMELMEELLFERNKENRDKKEKWELKANNITKKYKKAIQDYAKQEGDEAKFHREAAADYDHIYSQQPAQSPDGSPNSVAAYFNGKYQEMLRNKGRNEQNIADEVEPLTKKLKNRKHSFHDRIRGWTESEALEEAMDIMEYLIEEAKKKPDYSQEGPFHGMNKNVQDFFGTVDELFRKRKEQDKKGSKKDALEEALTLIEAIVNETVSIGDLQDTAQRRYDDREVVAVNKVKGYDGSDPAYRDSAFDDEKFSNAAKIVNNMPQAGKYSSHHSANKVFNAAWNSIGKRNKAMMDAESGTPEYYKAQRRYQRADDYASSDPVYARQRRNVEKLQKEREAERKAKNKENK